MLQQDRKLLISNLTNVSFICLIAELYQTERTSKNYILVSTEVAIYIDRILTIAALHI